jgi:hypothetical protein
VKKYKGNNCKGCKNREEAKARYMNHRLVEERRWNQMKINLIMILILLIVTMFLPYMIIV